MKRFADPDVAALFEAYPPGTRLVRRACADAPCAQEAASIQMTTVK
ncbi:MAG: hypothetical protein JOY64_11575 [Alphaproteobacteria bacterium]|nr:hypothetical protein [Alphaproteobacteria bacterium]MBV8408264.1 hypothetical protein [Alphaproteobacteria bacterium]